MAIDFGPMPNLSVSTPPFDPIGEQQKLATLSQLLSTNKLRNQLAPLQVQEQQQKVQAGGIENQLKTIQLQGQRALTDWLQNGDANEAVPATKFSSNDKIATYIGVSPDDPIMSVVRSMAQHHVPAPMLMAEAQGMLQRRTEYYKGTQEEQAAQKAERTIWQTTLAELHEAKPEDRSVLLATKLPLLQENSKTDPLLGAYASGLAGHPELIDQAYNVVSAENAALNLRETKAKAKEAEQKVIPEGGGLSPAGKEKLAQDVAIATNPQIQQGKIDVAKAEGQARAQVQLAMEPLRKQIDQQFADQKDARDKIETSVLKPYQDKMSDITMARNAVSQALDNPVSARAATFKMIGVAQPTGSHRVIPAEIAAFKYPGDIGQRSIEAFNDFLLGKPFTKEAISAMNSFIDGQERAAQQNLNSGVDNVNKLYNTKVGTELKTGANLPKALTADQIKAYATAHGVTEDEVKRQAKAKGIQVP